MCQHASRGAIKEKGFHSGLEISRAELEAHPAHSIRAETSTLNLTGAPALTGGVRAGVESSQPIENNGVDAELIRRGPSWRSVRAIRFLCHPPCYLHHS